MGPSCVSRPAIRWATTSSAPALWTAETTAGFLRRAVAWYAAQGIAVERLLTDNGSAYRSHHFAHVALELGISQRFTQAYRPQTNGKAERFIRTLLTEWAYATA